MSQRLKIMIHGTSDFVMWFSTHFQGHIKWLPKFQSFCQTLITNAAAVRLHSVLKNCGFFWVNKKLSHHWNVCLATRSGQFEMSLWRSKYFSRMHDEYSGCSLARFTKFKSAFVTHVTETIRDLQSVYSINRQNETYSFLTSVTRFHSDGDESI